MKPYPLKFQPEFKERVWGGRALEQFGFDVPEGNIGEAWVIGDHANGTTRVLNGALAGQGLDEIRDSFGESFFGSRSSLKEGMRFPLLIKLLDCNNDLSVQVHPNNDYEKLPDGELGKTEMWYVLDAAPGAKIIYGLREGITRDDLAEAIRENRIMECLNEVEAKPGDTFYIPAGTVHALGKGVLVAEIQQNSDTTYRLYDYNRPGLDGKPRELHIDDSLAVIHYANEGALHRTSELNETNRWLTLVESEYFVTEKGKAAARWDLSTAPDSFVIHVVCEGNGTIEWADSSLDLHAGDALLLPASLGDYALTGNMTVLRSRLP